MMNGSVVRALETAALALCAGDPHMAAAAASVLAASLAVKGNISLEVLIEEVSDGYRILELMKAGKYTEMIEALDCKEVERMAKKAAGQKDE